MTPLIELAAPRVIKRRAAMKTQTDNVQPIYHLTRVYLDCRRLRERRLNSGMTQCQLAAMAGMSHSSISSYEVRDVCVHRTIANALAAALGVTIEDISRYECCNE